VSKSEEGACGWVTQLVRGSYLDGPGLRTVVFLKGCPLRCGWCHNPETQRPEPEVLLDERRCIRCGLCEQACRLKAIALDREPRIDRARCSGQHDCVDACPTRALRPAGVRMSAAHVLQEIQKDALFYSNSGGGATFSGGEPLDQINFLADLLERCRAAHLHTTVDTCLAVEWDRVERVVRNTDLFLVDIKHASEPAMMPERVMDNTRRLAETGARIWIRIPVIPSWNDSVKEMRPIAAFVASLRGNIESVHLLPFHNTAEMKYRYLGRSWSFGATPHVPHERLVELESLFHECGLRTVLSGAPFDEPASRLDDSH
jgi:pyruvate formate lyase activating enzyme